MQRLTYKTTLFNKSRIQGNSSGKSGTFKTAEDSLISAVPPCLGSLGSRSLSPFNQMFFHTIIHCLHPCPFLIYQFVLCWHLLSLCVFIYCHDVLALIVMICFLYAHVCRLGPRRLLNAAKVKLCLTFGKCWYHDSV